jgi:hypothetical protein
VEKVNSAPTVREVCEDDYYEFCRVDLDGDGRFDDGFGIPYRGLGGSGEPAYFRLAVDESDSDAIASMTKKGARHRPLERPYLAIV